MNLMLWERMLSGKKKMQEGASAQSGQTTNYHKRKTGEYKIIILKIIKKFKILGGQCQVAFGGEARSLGGCSQSIPGTLEFSFPAIQLHNISNMSKITLTKQRPLNPKAICPLNHICRVILKHLALRGVKTHQRTIGIFLSPKNLHCIIPCKSQT